MNRVGVLLFLLFSLLAGAAPAQAETRMTVSLLPETASVAPGGTVTVAFVMRPARGWHGYWRNPGDAGDEPRVQWELAQGWSADALQFPVPDRLTLLGLSNYVFERDYALLATLHVPADATAGDTVPVHARLDYLVCTEALCVPETAELATALAIGRPGAPNAGFAAWRQALPRPLGSEGRFELANGRLRLAIPLPRTVGVDDPYFFPATLYALSHSTPQSVSRSGDLLIVETAPGRDAPRLQALEGVLKIGPGLGLSLTARSGPVPAAGVPVSAAETGQDASAIWLALLGALAGGLLLNVMPCVFPILSLKALSLARANETEAAARREAIAYAAGVVLMCVALGGLLLALRAGGAAVGWAFQLQDPHVILLLLLLVTAIALNLAGLFGLPAIGAGEGLTRRGGTAGAFFTGALAAFIATPCTGPFLGFALGAALVLPVWEALAVFSGLGLGLALPFLLLGFVPALRRRLPRPGPWMERFQRILSVPMLATALGLAWILGRQTGVDGMALGLGAALLLGLGLWWLGRRQGRGRLWLPLALVLVAVAAPMPFVRPVEAVPPPASTSGGIAAEPFSETRLAQLRAAGTPVFLYFTADWCLTCKVNERAAIAQSEVVEAFRARGIRVMAGDWTRGDPAIGRFLERHGRSGVPLYLYYAPGGEAEVLPQILTVGRLTGLGA